MKPPPLLTALLAAGPARATAATLRLATLSLTGLLLTAAAARSGSVSAESVWDSSDARQRALELVPRGATVTRSRCQDFEVGGFNSRYRCTVTYSEANPAEPSGSAPLP